MRVGALAVLAGLPMMFAPTARRSDLGEGSGEIEGHGQIKYSFIRLNKNLKKSIIFGSFLRIRTKKTRHSRLLLRRLLFM